MFSPSLLTLLISFLAEESWVVRSHAAAVNEGVIVAAGENVTITPNTTELFLFRCISSKRHTWLEWLLQA